MLNLREIEVFKPYDTEFPEALLHEAGFADADIDRWMGAEIVRVAKCGEEVLGIYALQRTDAIRFALWGVVVVPQVRKQGLGRWLVGHAIGVAESKGGRHVALPQTGSSRLFAHIGFVKETAPDTSGWRFDLIQE